ncbi:MAG: cobalamin-dependent protein [Bacteroidales bacterium]|nr:cobalamin-dependent protein [Bacteroidales bacterium]
MKILFVNPNRYRYPPVIPIGLEYLAGALSGTGYAFDVLDLCFSDNPIEELETKISEFRPDIAGFTIRQIDTVLFPNNEFFLPEIKEYVNICKSSGCQIILGGAGFSIMPLEILKYMEADYGIVGPGEIAFVELLRTLQNHQIPDRITDGFGYFMQNIYAFQRARLFNYEQYLKNGGIVGFRTQIGCTGSCIFCTEANKPVVYHKADLVGNELKLLKEQGYNHFHLCDSEFNMNLDHCIEVCKAICSISGPVRWTLYMKPEPFSDELFYWLAKSGADMLTLSLYTDNLDQSKIENLSDFISLAKKHSIKIAVDLSTGFPYEDISGLQKMVDYLNTQPVETVGVNACYRLYPGTKLCSIVRNDPNLDKHLIYPNSDRSLLSPVFINCFELSELQKLTKGKKKFRIEGFEKATNYQRIKE